MPAFGGIVAAATETAGHESAPINPVPPAERPVPAAPGEDLEPVSAP